MAQKISTEILIIISLKIQIGHVSFLGNVFVIKIFLWLKMDVPKLEWPSWRDKYIQNISF